MLTYTYRVTIERTEVTIVEVEAENEEQAELKAWQKWGSGQYGLAETNITDVTNIEDEQ